MKKAMILMSVLALNFSSVVMAKDTPLITGDIGGGTGTNNGNTYQEVHLGVNVNFTDWLTWRNTGFQRSSSTTNTITGLDSSMRLVLRTNFTNGDAHLFVGPGYRWASSSDNNAAFAEGGLGFRAGGMGLSAGAKYLKYDKDRYTTSGQLMKNEETTYFASITGNASFGK